MLLFAKLGLLCQLLTFNQSFKLSTHQNLQLPGTLLYTPHQLRGSPTPHTHRRTHSDSHQYYLTSMCPRGQRIYPNATETWSKAFLLLRLRYIRITPSPISPLRPFLNSSASPTTPIAGAWTRVLPCAVTNTRNFVNVTGSSAPVPPSTCHLPQAILST